MELLKTKNYHFKKAWSKQSHLIERFKILWMPKKNSYKKLNSHWKILPKNPKLSPFLRKNNHSKLTKRPNNNPWSLKNVRLLPLLEKWTTWMLISWKQSMLWIKWDSMLGLGMNSISNRPSFKIIMSKPKADYIIIVSKIFKNNLEPIDYNLQFIIRVFLNN